MVLLELGNIHQLLAILNFGPIVISNLCVCYRLAIACYITCLSKACRRPYTGLGLLQAGLNKACYAEACHMLDNSL